jgi:hypothetical protein
VSSTVVWQNRVAKMQGVVGSIFIGAAELGTRRASLAPQRNRLLLGVMQIGLSKAIPCSQLTHAKSLFRPAWAHLARLNRWW